MTHARTQKKNGALRDWKLTHTHTTKERSVRRLTHAHTTKRTDRLKIDALTHAIKNRSARRLTRTQTKNRALGD